MTSFLLFLSDHGRGLSRFQGLPDQAGQLAYDEDMRFVSRQLIIQGRTDRATAAPSFSRVLQLLILLTRSLRRPGQVGTNDLQQLAEDLGVAS